MPGPYHYNSLEDFLISTTMTVDGQINDGSGRTYPVKGREIEATVLFSDIAGFSARTLDLNPAATLAFVNHFFTWVGGTALRDSFGIVDKYIGDELMIVFSKEFGSEDPFEEAVQAARWMGEHDVFNFVPHIGIASGSVIVGYVGTPLAYNCSVFGAPVALAARCAGVKLEVAEGEYFSSSITFPASDWDGRDFTEVFPPRTYEDMEGNTHKQHLSWELRLPRTVELKNIPELEIREIVDCAMHVPDQSAEERAKEAIRGLREVGRYWPRNTASPAHD